jgi:hypothetical protein
MFMMSYATAVFWTRSRAKISFKTKSGGVMIHNDAEHAMAKQSHVIMAGILLSFLPIMSRGRSGNAFAWSVGCSIALRFHRIVLLEPSSK